MKKETTQKESNSIAKDIKRGIINSIGGRMSWTLKIERAEEEPKKIFIVNWNERHQITLNAKSKEDAKNKVDIGDYKEESESAEMDGELEAYEFKNG